MRFKVFVLTALLAGYLASPARASISYNYVTDSTSNTAAANGTVTVNLYLQETLTGGSTSLINSPPSSNVGLFGGAVAVNVVSGPGTISSVTLNTAPIASGGFGTGYPGNQTFIASNGSTAAILVAIALGTAQGPTVTQTTNGSTVIGTILLGTATISNVTASTQLSLTSLNNAPSNNSLANAQGEGNTVTNGNNGYDLDSTNNGFNGGPPPYYTGANDNSYGFTVTPQSSSTPEPSSMALCGLALSGMGFGAWRRRKAKLNAEAAPVESAPLAS
jgi:hypothetical protein